MATKRTLSNICSLFDNAVLAWVLSVQGKLGKRGGRSAVGVRPPTYVEERFDWRLLWTLGETLWP